MVQYRRRGRKRRIAEQQASYLLDPEPALPPFASTPEEIQRAVERNSIKRGLFFIQSLTTLNFASLIRRVEQISRGYDKEEWCEAASDRGIDVAAFKKLDTCEPPCPYPYYFCSPDILVQQPELVMYYRNVAMVSQKVMSDMGLNTVAYEAGQMLSSDVALSLARRFNRIVSALVITGAVQPQRHLEMAYTNLGASFDGSWRNQVGRLAYVEVITPLLLHLHRQGALHSVVYTLKGPVLPSDEETLPSTPQELLVTGQGDLESDLMHLQEQRVVYHEIRLRNGNCLLINRQITWYDAEGNAYRIGPDMISSGAETEILWGGELKGGADPAGSDEHWKTATRAFDRILLACEHTERSKPPLSFIATILVERVAREAAEWIAEGKLTSVYNLTQIADDPIKQQQFLNDLAAFLGCQSISS
jgi:hypothetical protein